jgi:hypothetical protein
MPQIPIPVPYHAYPNPLDAGQIEGPGNAYFAPRPATGFSYSGVPLYPPNLRTLSANPFVAGRDRVALGRSVTRALWSQVPRVPYRAPAAGAAPYAMPLQAAMQRRPVPGYASPAQAQPSQVIPGVGRVTQSTMSPSAIMAGMEMPPGMGPGNWRVRLERPGTPPRQYTFPNAGRARIFYAAFRMIGVTKSLESLEEGQTMLQAAEVMM